MGIYFVLVNRTPRQEGHMTKVIWGRYMQKSCSPCSLYIYTCPIACKKKQGKRMDQVLEQCNSFSQNHKKNLLKKRETQQKPHFPKQLSDIFCTSLYQGSHPKTKNVTHPFEKWHSDCAFGIQSSWQPPFSSCVVYRRWLLPPKKSFPPPCHDMNLKSCHRIH